MSRNVLRFKNVNAPKQQGEFGRLRVVGGPDTGTIFVLLSQRATIGRGEENDVVLSDLNTSRTHAEVVVSSSGTLINDLGSSNGMMVNGVGRKNTPLQSGDKINLGQTTLEFSGGTSTYPAISYGQFAMPKATAPSNQTILEKNKKIIFVLASLIAVATLLPSVEQKQRQKANKYVEPAGISGERSIGSLPPPQVIEESYKNADKYFREGFREYRVQNFTRARVAFETALQIYSAHPLAKIYLENTRKEMESEAKKHFEIARRDEEANRVSSAMSHYDAVKRLYFRDQTHPLYKEAENYTENLKKKMDDSGVPKQ